MIVDYSSQGGLRLAEPDDFHRFKLVLRGSFPTQRPEIDGVTLVDDANALVDIDIVPRLRGAPTDPGWRAGYARMIEAAARHGWIDEDSGSIRAHVKREP